MYKIKNITGLKVGKQAKISREQPLLTEICKKYGRDPSKCCLKVFYGNPLEEGQTLNEALWGDNPLSPPRNTRKNTTVFEGICYV